MSKPSFQTPLPPSPSDGGSPVDVHVSGLADAVAAILSLGVHGRVPVRVIEHDSIGSSQVNPEPSTPRGEDEAEDSLVAIEPVHQKLQRSGEGNE